MTNQIESTVNDINARFNRVFAHSKVRATATLFDKFKREQKKLNNTNYVQALLDNDVTDFSFIDNYANDRYLAIYALQKVTAIARALATSSSSAIDKYTLAIFQNARDRKNEIDNKSQNASLCANLEYESTKALKVRLQKASSTASTQRSSSSHALHAIHAAHYDADAKVLTFNTDSAIYKALDSMIAKATRRRTVK